MQPRERQPHTDVVMELPPEAAEMISASAEYSLTVSSPAKEITAASQAPPGKN